MSNRLKVAMIDLILSLHRRGWSSANRYRAEINRETVARYLKRARAAAKPAIAPSGSDIPEPAQNQPLRPPARIASSQRRKLTSHLPLRPVTLAAGPRSTERLRAVARHHSVQVQSGLQSPTY